MRELHLYAHNQIRAVQRKAKYENNFWKLATLLDFRIAPGDHAFCALGDPPLIVLNSYDFARKRNSFAGMHEIVHLLFKQRGIEQAVVDAFDGDRASAIPILESWCNQFAAVLLLPDHVVEDTLERHGDAPEAIIALHQHAQVGLGVPLRRYVFANSDKPAAAFAATHKGYVLDAARQYTRVPFTKGMFLPDDLIPAPGQHGVSEESSIITAILPDGRIVGVLAW